MSGILAQYAQNIAHTANNVQHAYAQAAQVQAEGARASQAALAGIKDSFDKSEQMKLEQQRLDSERELATQKAEEEGKFLKAITLADQIGADGKPIGTTKAMEIVNAQTEQARAQRAANAPTRTSLSDLTVGSVAAAGAGATKAGKWAWDKTKGALVNYQSKRASQSEQGQKIGATFSGADKTPSALKPKPTKASKLKESLTATPQITPANTLAQMPNPKGTPKGYGSFTGYTGGLSSLHDTTTPLLK